MQRHRGCGHGTRGRMNRIWPWAASILSGGLLGLAYPPFEQDWLIWIALVPLICALWFREHRSPLGHFLHGYVAGLVFFWIAFFWLTEVTEPGWFILSFYLAIYFGVWGWFAGTVVCPQRIVNVDTTHNRLPWMNSWTNLRLAASGAAAWVGLEWVRGELFTGFGWNGLGVALFEQTALIQIADFAGVGGISFLVALANLIAVITVRRFFIEVGKMRIRPHYDFTVTIALIAVAFSYGVHHYYKPKALSVPLKIAAIQANIPQNVKWDPAFEEHILQTYRRQTEVAVLAKPDLLIWPEASTPRPALNDESLTREVSEIAASANADFLFGTVYYDAFGGYNSAVLINPFGGAQVYNKIHLVPFGEYVPFRHSFPLFAWLVGDQVPADFAAGIEPAVLDLSRMPVRIAPLICFEDTLGELTRHFVLRGAQLLVVLTNDGWFRESAGSRQHLANSIFRTIENRRPMVRAANTGVTAFIDSLGRVEQQLSTADGNTFIEGFLSGTVGVPAHPVRTFYSDHGELFSVVCLFAALIAIQVHLVTSRRLTA